MSGGARNATWRYEIVGDVLTASNKAMTYTIALNVMYPPAPSAQANKGSISPRKVTQFLDGGARLYTVGQGRSARASARTVSEVASFTKTYLVPRVPRVATHPSLAVTVERGGEEERRLVRIETSLDQAVVLLRSIADGLGVK